MHIYKGEKYKINKTYNYLKGRIGEKLIEQMFIDLGYEVNPCGIETTIPNIQFINKLNNKKTKVFEQISLIPDYFISNRENGKSHLIEVKYRKLNFINIKYLKDYCFEGVLFILIGSNQIYCTTSDYLVEQAKNRNRINFHELELLKDSSHFEISEEKRKIIRQAEMQSFQVFKSIPDNNTFVNKVYNIEETDTLYSNNKQINISVIGSRNFNNYKLLCEEIDKIKPTKIIVAGDGVIDSLTKRYTIENNIECFECLSNNEDFEESVPINTNQQIVKELDHVLVFWDGESKDIKSLIEEIHSNKLNYTIIYY